MDKVLLINPDRITAEMETKYLSRKGYNVFPVSTIKQAEQAGHDLVFIDGTSLDNDEVSSMLDITTNPGPGRMLLTVTRGGSKRFVLRRMVGDDCSILLEAESMREVLERSCDEFDDAEKTIAALSGPLGNLIESFRKTLSKLFAPKPVDR